MMSSFPFSCTPTGRGLPPAIVQMMVRAPLPSATHLSLTSSPSLTVTEDGVTVAEGGSVV